MRKIAVNILFSAVILCCLSGDKEAFAEKFLTGNDYANASESFKEGYIMGFMAAYSLPDWARKATNIPAGLELGQMKAIFSKHLNNHPERRHHELYLLMWDALLDAFPPRKGN